MSPGDARGAGSEASASPWSAWARRLEAVLGALATTDRAGAPLPVEQAFARWVELTRAVQRADRSLFLIGNGASASMACHFACDLGKNMPVNAQVFTDPALMTAVGNDIGYEQVFAAPLRWRGRPGDLLVAISSSGRSPNVVAGCQAAREQGVHVVGLSGMSAENPLRGLSDLSFWVPATTYGEAETTHAAILHHWADLVLGGR